MVCSTIWGSRFTTIAVNILSGKVERVDTGAEISNSFTIATMSGSIALAVESGFGTPGRLMISHAGEWDWVPVDSNVQVSPPDEVSNILKEVRSETFLVKTTVGPELPLEAILIQKRGKSGLFATVLYSFLRST